MTQRTYTGEVITPTYEEFRLEAIKPRRTQRCQRQEIIDNLDRLTVQGDFHSLEIIRKISSCLANAEYETAFDLFFRVREMVYMNIEDYKIVHRKA